MKRFLLFALALFLSGSSFATNYTVTSEVNGTNNDGVSLRWAITQSSGTDTIKFNIPGIAPHTINLLTELPYLSVNAVFIDGSTQPSNGYTGSDPKIIIRDSTGIDNGLYCFVTSNAKIKGVWVRDFDTYGIYCFGSFANVIIEECKITNNGTGIYILGSYASGDIIKCRVEENVGMGIYVLGSLAWGTILGSLITNNGGDGVNIFGSSAWCEVEANEIVTNSGDGIEIFGAGAYGFIRNNLVSGNIGNGIVTLGVGGSVIKGNRVGTDSSGNFSWGNALNGVSISESNDSIGGAGMNEANIIAFNGQSGVYISSGNGNLITHNSIFCNGTAGITLNGGANNNQQAPVILSATGSGASGTSSPNALVELFTNPSSPQCENCEGKIWIGSAYADNLGLWAYNGIIFGGSVISATATDTGSNNTSGFSECEEVIGLSVLESQHLSVKLYPNPATDEFYVTTNFSAPSQLEIFDVSGRSMMKTNGNDAILKVEVSSLPRGVYLYKLSTKGKENIFTGKVTLQ